MPDTAHSTVADEARVREDLATALRAADRLGYSEGVFNHFSAVVGPVGSPHYLLNRFGYFWSQITPDRLELCNLETDPPGGRRGPNGEKLVEVTAAAIHGRFHAARPEAQVLFHTHMPWATALCCAHDARLEMIHQSSCRFHGRIAYDPLYTGVAEADAEGDRLAEAMGDADILFMANHGVLVSGPTVAQALDDLYYLERACELQVKAMSTGLPLNVLPADVIDYTRKQFEADRAEGHSAATYLAAWKREIWG